MSSITFDKNLTLVASACTALFVALKQSRLKNNAILVPNYVCDVLLYPILESGFVPVYYPITRELKPDWVELEKIVNANKCDAIVMIHYFGQPQDIEQFKKFCVQYGLLLIEDNAHGFGGFLDDQLLGTYGDIGISSPKKILGLSSGGVLHNAGDKSLSMAKKLDSFPIHRLKPWVKNLLSMFPQARRQLKSLSDRKKNWSEITAITEERQQYYKVDAYSKYKIRSTNWEQVARVRRKNWSDWGMFAIENRLRPIAADPHRESCPWAMPAYACDHKERNNWLLWGVKNRISIFSWPTLPENVINYYPEAAEQWKLLICFSLDANPSDAGTLP